MACGGAQERRDGLIRDMTAMRARLTVEDMLRSAQVAGVVVNDSDAVAAFFAGYLATALSRLAAAVIALAGPCCGDCDE